MNFRIGFSIFGKNITRILIEIALMLQVTFINHSVDILLSVLIPEHRMCFCLFMSLISSSSVL